MTGLPDLPLSSGDRETYRAVATGGEALAGHDVGRLVGLGLIAPNPDRDGQYIAHDPRGAVQQALSQVQETIMRAAQCMAELPAVEGLTAAYDSHRWYSGLSELLETRDEMNARIAQALRTASSEMWTAQPGAPVDRDPEVQRAGMERVLDLRARGISVRSLYNVAVRDHATTSVHLAAAVEAGAEVSTLEEAFPRLVIIDGTHLFIDNCVRANGEDKDAGWHVTDRATVAWAHTVYQHMWARATRWQDGDVSSEMLTERQKAILRALEEGEPQHGVGPRLGLSDRTVTKEIAAARAAVGAQTVYQLMAWWGRQQAEA
ncbi:hypothetical protein GTX14_35170 [Streptomyces sp. SID4944]|nr:hypothetical protein [Streptomyces sp. SID4944]